MHANVDRELAGRETTNTAAKDAIARACLQLLRDGDSVFLDSGTTVDALARALAQSSSVRLSVLTSSLERGHRAGRRAATSTPCSWAARCGASTARWSASWRIENLQRFTFSTAFIGASGFSEAGVSVGSLAEAGLKAAAIERARRVVLPVDHSKVGATDFARVCELDAVDVVVMDETTPAVEDLCAAYDIELVRAA